MKLAIVGTGMIGGAVARAARTRQVASHITGVEPNGDHAATALEFGVVDSIATDVPTDADFIVLCCPSDQVAGWVVKLKDRAVPICDVGSVKAPIITELRRLLDGAFPNHFVPSHPIAGSEKTGPAHAPSDLFDGRAVALTPVAESDPSTVAQVEKFWQALGAHVLNLEAAEHDELLAVTSHLPHYLAFAFMLQVEHEALALAGGGFSDFTRIAASNPEMWWRIFKMNQGALLGGLGEFEANLARLREALENEDDELGLDLLNKAARRRNEL